MRVYAAVRMCITAQQYTSTYDSQSIFYLQKIR